MHISLAISEVQFKKINRYLFSKPILTEKAGFIFASSCFGDGFLDLTLVDWYAIKLNEYKIRTLGHIELHDTMRGKMIKKAFDLNACLIEVHSHPYDVPAEFSGSDAAGFRDFVPHVRWRLSGKPYVALVFSSSDFDALVWAGTSNNSQPLTELVVGSHRLKPNNYSLGWSPV